MTGLPEASAADDWRRLCLRAFENLPSDTPVTMTDVDAILTWCGDALRAEGAGAARDQIRQLAEQRDARYRECNDVRCDDRECLAPFADLLAGDPS